MLCPPRMRCALLAVLIGLGISVAVAPPHALAESGKGRGGEAQALALFREGQELKKAGKFKQALAKTQEAYAALPTPTLLWPLADLYYLSVEPIAGLKALARYRREMTPSDMEPGQQLADAEKLEGLLRAQLAYLRVVVPAGTKVSLDGEELESVQRAERVPVNPGSHRMLLVSERGRSEYKFEARTGEELTVPGAESATVASAGYFPHPLTWGAVGLTSALLLSSTVVGGLALSDAQSLSSRCPDRLCTVMNAADLVALNEQISNQHNHALAARVLLGLTAVFAVGTTALILFDWQRQRSGRTLLGPKAAPTDGRAGLAPSLPPGIGMLLGGRL